MQIKRLENLLWSGIGLVGIVWFLAICLAIPGMYSHQKNLEALSRVQGCEYIGVIENAPDVVFMRCGDTTKSFIDPYYLK